MDLREFLHGLKERVSQKDGGFVRSGNRMLAFVVQAKGFFCVFIERHGREIYFVGLFEKEIIKKVELRVEGRTMIKEGTMNNIVHGGLHFTHDSLTYKYTE